MFQNRDAVKEWLKDVSFTLKSLTSKNIASVGMAVVFPVRRTDAECGDPPRETWCGANRHWCDGGCPTLIHSSLHWGLIPALTASDLEWRYAHERARGKEWRILFQGKVALRLAEGEEVTLSQADRVEGIMVGYAPRQDISDTMNGIVGSEGIEEARGEEACEDRANSKTGCAFAEVSKFNIGIDIVYFEDGTIWGNYGYGYALPNPDGIFTRVDERDFPGPR